MSKKKEKIDLPNVVLSETKAIYKKEYQLGLWAIKLIKEKIGIQLEEAEAGYIALHLVNFSTKNIIRSFLRFFRTVFPFLHVCNPLVFYREEIFFKKLSKNVHIKF